MAATGTRMGRPYTAAGGNAGRPRTAATGTLWTAAKPLFAEKNGRDGDTDGAAKNGRNGDALGSGETAACGEEVCDWNKKKK